MIIKKFLNSIYINNYTLLLLFLCLITGLIKEVLVIFIIIIIHEFGHFLIMSYYKWNIKKINIYPFGGVTTLDDVIDKPLFQEFLVTIMGPIFQEILFFIIIILHNNYYISDYMFSLFKNYNLSILIFNLLPIIPLDGAKIFNIIFNKFFNFRISYLINIIISILTITLFLLLYNFDSSYYIIILFLIFQTLYSLKNRKMIYTRFILERRIHKNEYKKYKKIRKLKDMYRNKKHLILDENIYKTEKNYLKNKTLKIDRRI